MYYPPQLHRRPTCEITTGQDQHSTSLSFSRGRVTLYVARWLMLFAAALQQIVRAGDDHDDCEYQRAVLARSIRTGALSPAAQKRGYEHAPAPQDTDQTEYAIAHVTSPS
jgi:hypothetical protein